MAQRRYSSGSGGTGGGGNLGGGSGDLPSSSEIQAKIDTALIDGKFEEYYRLLDELEAALAREAEEANNNTETPTDTGETETPTDTGETETPDTSAPPEEPTPTTDPTDTSIPDNNGSGIRHYFDSGFSYEFTANDDGTYNADFYDPSGSLVSGFDSAQLRSFGEGDVAQSVISSWYEGELNENFEGWDDTASDYFKYNFPEQWTGTEDTPTDTGETETPTDTGGTEEPVKDPLEGVTYTAPDGTEIDFSEGNTNSGYRELDNQIDDLIESYEDAETSEEEKTALAKLNEADENLTQFAENLVDIQTTINKEFEKEQAILDDLEAVAESASATEEEKIEAKRLIPIQQNKINRLADGHGKINDLVADINETTSKELTDVINGEKDENDLLDTTKEALKWTGLTMGVLAGGTSLYETWFGDDEVGSTKSASESMAEANAAIEQNLPKSLELQEQFQPQIDNLENKSNYNKLFGSDPAVDFLNSNPELQDQYKAYLLGPDGIQGSGDEPENVLTQQQWLEQWVQDNPDAPEASAYRDSYSRVGTQEKLLNRNMQNAKNLYTPEELGGMGYTPDDFRTADQRKTMKLANELIDSPVNTMLEDSVMSELGKGGDMGDAYYGNMRNNILGGLAPSLAKQGGLLSGGVQRLAREMTGDYQRTLQSRQSAAQGYLNQRGNQLTNFSNLANANTVSPSSIFGLPSGSQLVGNQYAQAAAPTGSQLLADPTSAYSASVGQQNIMNDLLAQANQQSTSEKLNNTVNTTYNLLDLIEKGEQIGQD
jgi:hypothetical protein